MIELQPKVLDEHFQKMTRLVAQDIKTSQSKREGDLFSKDVARIRNDLLVPLSSHPSPDESHEFIVVGSDGSGKKQIGMLDDVIIDLFSWSVQAFKIPSDVCSETPPEPLREDVVDIVGNLPEFDLTWRIAGGPYSFEVLQEFLFSHYVSKSLEDLILPFFQDYLSMSKHQDNIRQLPDLSKVPPYAEYLREGAFLNIKSLLGPVTGFAGQQMYEEMRAIGEYSLLRKILDSFLRPKYLFIDGSLSLFIHRWRKYPSRLSGFLLRELCMKARDTQTCILAVSKNHTIPFTSKISDAADILFGQDEKWFCRIPSDQDVDGQLQITALRHAIPPPMVCTYLYSFSNDSRPLRIDLDRIWWNQNISVYEDRDATRQNEIQLFRDIEVASRDARWFGYPLVLGHAHNDCVIGREDILIVQDELRKYLGGPVSGIREDYGL